MRIFTDEKTNLYVNAISKLSDGTETQGKVFDIVSGPTSACLNFDKALQIPGAINGFSLNALFVIMGHVKADDTLEKETKGAVVTTEFYKEENAGHELVVAHDTCEDVPPGHSYAVASDDYFCTIEFQNGPVATEGINGLTNEVLLAILIHRTETLDAQYPCDENKEAIEHMKKALEAFNKRTANRKARGVHDQLVK